MNNREHRLDSNSKQRLKQLDADVGILDRHFSSPSNRDEAFRSIEKSLAKREKERLFLLRDVHRRPGLCLLEDNLAKALVSAGFVQVVTPMIMTAESLERMSIGNDHPLRKQVFWVDDGHCLRPMLAPNLYVMLRSLKRIWGKPVRIFEIGTCFRRDSQGRSHLNEFTMLNLVELETEYHDSLGRLRELISTVMSAVGMSGCELCREESKVYGETIDIVVTGLEVGSAVIGPNPLDDQWGITDPWIGIGFGLERLLVVKEGYDNIARVGRSLAYLDGASLRI